MNTNYSSTLSGWREWVSLPDIGVSWIEAKIDTGARTSAIHARSVTEFSRDGTQWVRFTVDPWQRSEEDCVEVELPIHDRRSVRSSSGHAEERIVVQTALSLAGRTVPVELTLTNRPKMVFRMLIGRQALRQGFLVDAKAQHLGPRPSIAIRRKNIGK